MKDYSSIDENTIVRENLKESWYGDVVYISELIEGVEYTIACLNLSREQYIRNREDIIYLAIKDYLDENVRVVYLV
jgi:hypothetical protein